MIMDESEVGTLILSLLKLVIASALMKPKHIQNLIKRDVQIFS